MKKVRVALSGCLMMSVVVFALMCWLSSVGVLTLIASLKGVAA